MEFDPAKHVTLQSGLGGSFQISMARLPDFPPLLAAWGKLTAALWRTLWLGTIVAAPLTAAYYWFAVRFGIRSKETKHERGSQLVEGGELKRMIKAHNRTERARELNDLMGWRWRLSLPNELRGAGVHQPFEIAGMPYPWHQEQNHTMLIGSTGTGKTVTLLGMLSQIRERGQRAVVFDLTGGYIEAFYDPTRDTILHPLDARCPQWNIFDECSTPAEFMSAAEALVPHDGGGQEQFWVLAARTIFVEMSLSLKRSGKCTSDALADGLMRADLASVHAALKGTLADPLTAPEAARMAESIRAVFNVNAQALLYLPKSGPRFSIRDWVRDERKDGSILFISARYVDLAICRTLLTLWLDLAMNTLMSMRRTSDLRMWFLLDELGALHRLPALEIGLQTARNFGGAIVTGLHTFAKFKDTYGDNIAANLSSLCWTKLILMNADEETASWCSDCIGRGEVRAMEESYSYGHNNSRDAVSLNSNKRIEQLVLPDDIKDLKKLTGFIKFSGGFPAAPINLKPRHWPQLAEGFVPRSEDEGPGAAGAEPGPDLPRMPPASQQVAAVSSTGSEGGEGRRSDPRQGTLALPMRIPAEVARVRAGQGQRNPVDQAGDSGPHGGAETASTKVAALAAGTPVRAVPTGAPAASNPPKSDELQAADEYRLPDAIKGTAQHGRAAPAKRETPPARSSEKQVREQRDLLDGASGRDRDDHGPDIGSGL